MDPRIFPSSPIVRFIFFIIILQSVIHLKAQNINVTGTVIDEFDQPVIGANVYIEESFQGQATDRNGRFIITSNTNPPYTVVVSMVGYEIYKKTIESTGEFDLDIKLEPAVIFGQEVVVSASMVEENIMASTITVEKMGIKQIQQMPQANFYDGLYQMKGIDMNTQSLTFKIPNSRGFNSNTNYRFNQIIDGINNMAPGLNFAAGNLLGLPQLDIESIEMLTGASSALYGTGGMNGTLIINSKNPFDYQGLSVSVQTGMMNVGSDLNVDANPYYDISARYAKKITDKLAFKVTGSYLSADDWVAGDRRDKNFLNDPSSTRQTNPGYNGVNVYGDDVPLNLGLIAPAVGDGFARQLGYEPGQAEYDSIVAGIVGIIPDQDVTRTGWEESDLVNYEARNLKANVGIHYKLNENTTAIVQGGYAQGQAIYSAQNRFSISDFSLYNFKAEINNPDYMFNYWYSKEDAGLTYDAGGVAAFINESWKPSELWYGDYLSGYLVGTGQFGLTEEEAHVYARQVADNRDQNGNPLNPERPSIPLPGSQELFQLRDSLKRIPLGQGGSRVLDFSSMGQFTGRYNFRKLLDGRDLVIGFQYRYFIIDSDGTIFADDPDEPIRMHQYGVYAQYLDGFIEDRLKLNLSARYDQDSNFDPQFTPRLSLGYAAGKDRNHNIRASVQTAFRFPAVADQWTDLNVGVVQVVGGNPSVQAPYNFSTNPTYPLAGTDPLNALPDTTNGVFNTPNFTSERVFATEIGYKSVFLDGDLFFDMNVFRNVYSRFQGFQLLVQNPFEADETRYQTTVTTDKSLTNWGWSMGVDYQLPKFYQIGGNVAYSTLNDNNIQEGFQTNFNTPEYRFNLKFGNRKLYKQLGFNINYRWQQAFIWESSFGVGEVPAFGTFDMVLTYGLPQIKSVVKIGGSNIFNDYYTTSFGSSGIGGLYYISFTFDQMMR